jgi:predicted nucleic acid-binding protein
MIVVADSTPMHYLVLIDQVALLPELYGSVLIPPAVVKELSSIHAPAKVRDWLIHPPAWFRVESADSAEVDAVPASLDRGEREAIALARSVGADLVLMDDSAGRAEARRRNLQVTGTIGVLRTAAERDLIDVPAVISALRDTTFYFDEDLLRSAFGKWL